MMPKGLKFEKGYASVKGVGKSYHEISRIMTERGYKMNHSTARNILNRAMKKIAKNVCDGLGKTGDHDEMSTDPIFQESIMEIMNDVCC